MTAQLSSIQAKMCEVRGLVAPILRALNEANAADTAVRPDYEPEWTCSVYGHLKEALMVVIQDHFGVYLGDEDPIWISPPEFREDLESLMEAIARAQNKQ